MNKVVLYIKDADNVFQAVDLFEDETISVTSKIQDIRDISKVFTDFSQSFTLPASKKNNKVFKHFYNYFISEGAFDARKKVDARLEINYIPFRDGKIFLNGVKMKDNKAFAYNVTFFGNTVNLTDILGDDELTALNLNTYNHTYSTDDVKTGLTTGINKDGDATSLIYPLITHTKRLYFNSNTNHSSDTIVGDLSYHNQNSHSRDVALEFRDLKPALKVSKIIDAISTKYGLEFTSGGANDFFGSTPMENLYLWLSRAKGEVVGSSEGENTKVLGSWQKVSGDTVVSISLDGTEFSYIRDVDITFSNLKYKLTITPKSGDESKPYDVELYRNGVLVSERTNQIGTTTSFYTTYPQDNFEVPFYYIVKSSETFSFTPSLRASVEEFEFDPQDPDIIIYEENLDCGGELTSLSEIIISSQIPRIKIIDFLSGIFKMFNLTAFFIQDRNDADYGKIKVMALDDFYNDDPQIFDVTKYVDSKETDIEATIPFSEIDFEYEEPKTLLMKQHKETFNQVFGDEEFKLDEVDRGKPYKVKVPFEHFKFERLIDENPSGIGTTDIQWGYSSNDNFKPDADATPQPTANYDPVLTAPLLFYGIRITGITSGGGINWNGSTHEELLNYWRPSNTNENGTSSVAPAFTLNFDNEVDEWNFQDYDGETNSLFKKFYKTYIEDAFNAKKRIFKLTAHLPNSILLNYKLNDRFQIGDKVFTINSIDTNLKTGESKLELLNVL